MSLVSEALKKAEREAAAREARQKGLPVPLETPLQPYRARRGQRGRGNRRAGAFVAIFAGAGTAIFVALFVARSGEEKKDSNKGATVAPSARGGAAEPSTTSTDATSTAAPAQPPVEEAKSPESAATAPTAGGSTQPPGSSAPATPAARQTAVPPSASESAPPSAAPSSPKTAPNPATAAPSASESQTSSPPPKMGKGGDFVRRVDFPDGSKLELGGIAYSESAPFAYLNGKLLKVGEETAGYLLVKIERDRVVVRGAAGELTLRLKPR